MASVIWYISGWRSSASMGISKFCANPVEQSRKATRGKPRIFMKCRLFMAVTFLVNQFMFYKGCWRPTTTENDHGIDLSFPLRQTWVLASSSHP